VIVPDAYTGREAAASRFCSYALRLHWHCR
jgi:hypothetical protein